MARTDINPNTKPTAYPALPVTADSLDVVWVAADTVNQNQFSPSGDDLILVKNDDAGAQPVTLTSAPDAQGRTGDIAAYSIGAGEVAVFRVKTAGWMQSDGKVYLEAASANVFFAVIPLL